MAEKILVVDDEKIIRETLAYILRKEGFEVGEAANGKEAYEKVLGNSFDLVLTDLEMPLMKGIELLERVTQVSPQTLVMVITAYGSLETAIAALRKGASDYILKPLEFDELLIRIRRLLEYRKLMVENQMLRKELQREYDFSNIIGKSTEMQRVFDAMKTAGPTDSTVLITGKSGTGKELVARAIHYNSHRSSKPFIAVNCGAIPDTLIESELFGHKRGAFTGAVADKIGYFKAAEGGTLFLDEISEMPLQLQVKMLRAIEQKEILPVGVASPINVDVRFIASTNRDLRAEMESGRFREDLFYRLNVVEIHLPSLADRKEDIPILVNHFVDKYRKQMSKSIKGVTNQVMGLLMQYSWKGEIRELENVIERASIFCNEDFISIQHLPELLRRRQTTEVPTDGRSLADAIKELEREYILSVLQQFDFDKEKTARTLKISLPTLYRRIKDLEITQ